MTDKPYGLEVTFKTKIRTFWFKTSEERREEELKLIRNPKAQIVKTIGRPD